MNNTTPQGLLRLQWKAGKVEIELPQGSEFEVDLVDFKGKHVIGLEEVRNRVA